MTIRTWTVPVVAMALTATLSATLTACSGDDEEPKAGTTPSASVSASVDPSDVSPDYLPKVPDVKGPHGALADLDLDQCDTAPGKQTIAGKITSSAQQPVDYLVTLSWTTSDSDVMGRGFAVLQDVAPGDTEAFEIQAKVAKGAEVCVPGVVYGTIAPG